MQLILNDTVCQDAPTKKTDLGGPLMINHQGVNYLSEQTILHIILFPFFFHSEDSEPSCTDWSGLMVLVSGLWKFIVQGFRNNMNKINQRTQSNSKLLQLLANRNSVQHLRHNQNDWPGKQRPSFASTLPLKQSRSVSQIQITTKRKTPGLPSYKKPNQIISSSKSLSLLPKTQRRASQRTKFNTGSTQPLRSTNNRTKAGNVEMLSRRSTQKDEMDGYLIDYMAFNYLGKVIDNPELWTKYVHKKQGL